MLVGTDAVKCWQPMIFAKTPSVGIYAVYLLVLMLCAPWYECREVVAAPDFLKTFSVGVYDVYLLVLMLCTRWH